MNDLRNLLESTATRAAEYREAAATVPVFPGDVQVEKLRAALEVLPDGPTPAAVVVHELASAVEPALVTTTGPRYF